MPPEGMSPFSLFVECVPWLEKVLCTVEMARAFPKSTDAGAVDREGTSSLDGDAIVDGHVAASFGG